ncbi:hypothetical protein BYT27DRAFT_7248481 [Phlegmacium glaucopus]|nr:hypothetical protein BYT27DRAFT_7248481 [Phlegmacium glaucopus]
MSISTALIARASTPSPSPSVNSETNNPRSIPELALTQEDAGTLVLLKVDGKKRVVDEDNDATATEGESPLVEGPAKQMVNIFNPTCIEWLLIQNKSFRWN